MFSRKTKEPEGKFITEAHECQLPKLLFKAPQKHTRVSVGTVWQCKCSRKWKSVSGMMWNEWTRVYTT